MGTGDRQTVMKPILVNARGAGAAAARSPLCAKVSRVAYPPQGLVDGGGAVADTKALVEWWSHCAGRQRSRTLLPAASENTHEFVLWVWMDVRFVCVDCVIRVPVCSPVCVPCPV
jgi:hypothetical protein